VPLPYQLRQGFCFYPEDSRAGDDPERTTSALQAAKARGKKLGNPKVREAGILGNVVIQDTAKTFAANVLPVIREIQSAGTKSNAAIAAKLNERRVPTARGGVWTHVQVRAVIGRGSPSH